MKKLPGAKPITQLDRSNRTTITSDYDEEMVSEEDSEEEEEFEEEQPLGRKRRGKNNA